MLDRSQARRRLLLPLTAVLLLSRPEPVRAFDTGHHHDMTRAALQGEGFAPGATVIQIAQVSNWLVDYYSSSPLSSQTDSLAHLHFDNLATPAQIRNLWNRLARNTHAAVAAAAADVRSARNPAKRYRRMVHLAVLIGASLHPVQDFYSHSNWVEVYPMRGDVYGTRTWFDTPSPSLLLHTGLVGSSDDLEPTGDPARDHGGYDAGMNHDSYSRPRWSQAYVYAYSASRQWLRAIRQWVEQVDPAIWRDLLALQLARHDRAALALDLTGACLISLWVNMEGKDGAWKGRGSGDPAFLGTAMKWAAMPNSIFVERFSAAAASLARGMRLRDTDPGAAPAMPRVALGVRAVEVRTLHAAALDGTPDTFRDADLYAAVTIAGQRYVESTLQDEDDVRPPWLSVHMVPDSVAAVRVRYELYDEDDGTPDIMDIHPAAGRRYAEFQLDVRSRVLSGDLLGVHNTKRAATTLRAGGGDNYPASVDLYVNVRELEPQTAQAVP